MKVMQILRSLDGLDDILCRGGRRIQFGNAFGMQGMNSLRVGMAMRIGHRMEIDVGQSMVAQFVQAFLEFVVFDFGGGQEFLSCREIVFSSTGPPLSLPLLFLLLPLPNCLGMVGDGLVGISTLWTALFLGAFGGLALRSGRWRSDRRFFADVSFCRWLGRGHENVRDSVRPFDVIAALAAARDAVARVHGSDACQWRRHQRGDMPRLTSQQCRRRGDGNELVAPCNHGRVVDGTAMSNRL